MKTLKVLIKMSGVKVSFFLGKKLKVKVVKFNNSQVKCKYAKIIPKYN